MIKFSLSNATYIYLLYCALQVCLFTLLYHRFFLQNNFDEKKKKALKEPPITTLDPLKSDERVNNVNM